MRRLSFLILIPIFSCSVKRENAKANEEISLQGAFEKADTLIKYDSLVEPPPQKSYKLKTDSSLIETKYFEDLNSIREFNRLDSIDRTYYKDYYLDTHKIKEQGVTEDGDCVGLWKYYDKKGLLIKEIDFETGIKKLFNNRTEPFDSVFLEMRFKADSMLIAFFGVQFFKEHIQWHPSDSYYYSQNSSGNWFEIPEEKPEEFLFRYFICLDPKHKYSTIEFKLDRTGRMINSSQALGLLICPTKCKFNIDYCRAIEIGRQSGLSLNNEKHYVYLSWTKPLIGSFLGDYELILAEFKDEEREGENQVIDNFNVVVINPWTGSVLRKAKFQRFRYVHRYSSSTSGLVESK